MHLSREVLLQEVPKLKDTLIREMSDVNTWLANIHPPNLPEQLVNKQESFLTEMTTNPESEADIEILLWKLQAQSGTKDMPVLTKEISEWLNMQQKAAKKKISKYADRKVYSLNAETAKQIFGESTVLDFMTWEVKKKYFENMKLVYSHDQDALARSRRLRSRKIDILNAILKLIKDLGDSAQSESELSKQFFKVSADYDEFTKDVDGTNIKKTKKKKAQNNNANKPSEENLRSEGIINQEENIKETSENAQGEGNKNYKAEQQSTHDEGTPRKTIPEGTDGILQVNTPNPKDTDRQNNKAANNKSKTAPAKKKASENTKMDEEKPQNKQQSSKLLKPNTQKKIDTSQQKLNMFFKAKPSAPVANKEPVRETQMEVQEQDTTVSPFEEALENIGRFMRDLQSLREQFKAPERQAKPGMVYAHIWDNNFFLKGYEMVDPRRSARYINPTEEYSNVNYEDSAADYDFYQGQNIQKAEERSQDASSDASSDHGTIVSSQYLSKDEGRFSEAGDDGPKAAVNLDGGQRWLFTPQTEQPKASSFGLVCLEATTFPLLIKPSKSKITVAQKLFFITTVHGSYDSVEELIDKLKDKFPDMTKQSLRGYIVEHTNKDKLRRLIQPSYTLEIQETFNASGINLEAIATQRYEQNQGERQKKKAEKRRQKQLLKAQNAPVAVEPPTVLSGQQSLLEFGMANLAARQVEVLAQQEKQTI